MKKLFTVFAVAAVFLLAGCSGKNPATLENFKTTMEAAGYTMHDVSAQYDSGIAKSVTVALKDGYQVEFFMLTNEENAATSFASNKNRLEALAGGNTTTSVTASNYSSYTLTTKDQFYKVSRIGDTMIYLRVPRAQKDAVSELVKSLGY